MLALVLMLALTACDTMGPQTPEIVATNLAPAETPTAETAPTSPPATPETPADEPIEGESEETAGSDLFGVTWEWAILLDSMGQTEVSDPTRYTAVFNPDGSLNVMADCNVVNSEFITDGFNIEILPGAATMVECGPESQDQLFINSLNATNNYMVQDGELFMSLTGGTGTMVFRPGTTGDTPDLPGGAGEPALVGTTWEWVSTATGAEEIVVADPTRYTILFNADGTAAIQADCNSVIANYTANEDSTMTITLGPSTLMACPADSQADVLMAALPNVALYSFIDGHLVLDLPVDSGAIRFRPAGATTAPIPAPDAPAGLTGIAWEWVGTSAPGETITVQDPSRYQIFFNEDGTAGIVADCNVGNAEFTSGDEGSLSITLGVSTLAFCEDSQDTQFREGLAAAAFWSIDNGDLLIDLNETADNGTMRFRAGAGGTGTGPGDAEPLPEPGDETGLTGVTWQWVSTTTPVEEITATDPSLYTIVFFPDGTAGIKADCNVGNAEFSTGEGGSISILLGVSTLAFCEESQDQIFRTGLEAAAVYSFDENGDLLLDMMADSGTMRFTPVADGAGAGESGAEGGTTTPPKGDIQVMPPEGMHGGLVGPAWHLTQIVKRDGTVTINEPARYTISFNADGTANFQADCNVGGATFTASQDHLTITPGPITMAYCGPGSLDQMFLGGLTNAQSFAIQDGNLVITMLYESGTLVFQPVR